MPLRFPNGKKTEKLDNIQNVGLTNSLSNGLSNNQSNSLLMEFSRGKNLASSVKGYNLDKIRHMKI